MHLNFNDNSHIVIKKNLLLVTYTKGNTAASLIFFLMLYVFFFCLYIYSLLRYH